MLSSEQLFAMSLNECVDAVEAVGKKVTVLIQGHMGCGKSSLLKILSERNPDHVSCYFDCTLKMDQGDMMMPKILGVEDGQFVRFVPTEEMGIHHSKPIILMIDELGKANQAVKNALMRVMLERKLGSYSLHPDSIVFATTNLGSEGVGDLLMPHHRNRITTVRLKKPTATEWIEDFAYNAGIHPTIIGWVKDMGEVLFQSFEDVENPDAQVGGNPYIFHPKAQRAAFVTPRSLELASHWIWQRDVLSANTLKQALMGTIGVRGGADLEAYVSLFDQLPRQQEILETPDQAKIPTSASGAVMVVDRALATMSQEFVSSWMTYLSRLDTEAQALFVAQAVSNKYAKRHMVVTNPKFTQWCLANNYLYAPA